MGFTLPYRCDRRYLTGVDWIIGTLDCQTRRATGAGSSSQIILELEGRLEEAALRDAVERFAARFPVLSGYPSRDALNLAPFWKVDRSSGKCRVEALPDCEESEAAVEALCRALDVPFTSRREHAVFRLVHAGADRTFVGMAFDHWLFDARGAELFLGQLAAFAAGDETSPSTEAVRPARDPALTDWADKFRAGRNVNRALRACGAVEPGRFPIPPGPCGFRQRFMTLNATETHQLTEAAYQAGGFLIKMPYLLALAARAIDKVFAKRGMTPSHYVIPVSIDRRAARLDTQPLFFNQFSFLHFVIARADLEQPGALAQSLARQMYGQTKEGLPEDFEKTMMLMRILPVGLLAAGARRLFKGNMGSFAFSFLGESAFLHREFLGLRVANLFHAPRVSTPPGLGVFFNEFAGRMNVTLSHLAPLLTGEEASGILQSIFPRGGGEATAPSI